MPDCSNSGILCIDIQGRGYSVESKLSLVMITAVDLVVYGVGRVIGDGG